MRNNQMAVSHKCTMSHKLAQRANPHDSPPPPSPSSHTTPATAEAHTRPRARSSSGSSARTKLPFGPEAEAAVSGVAQRLVKLVQRFMQVTNHYHFCGAYCATLYCDRRSLSLVVVVRVHLCDALLVACVMRWLLLLLVLGVSQ